MYLLIILSSNYISVKFLTGKSVIFFVKPKGMCNNFMIAVSFIINMANIIQFKL